MQDPTRRHALRLLGRTAAGAGLLTVSGCSYLDVVQPRIQVDASKPYTPVDPRRAQAIINAYRAKNGVAPLGLDDDLTRIARTYAQHMSEVDKMGHALEPWGPLDRRLRTGGYAYYTAGENLGVGYRNIEEAFEGWRNSPAHDRGMKDADMTVMGIASVYAPKTGWKCFWCLMFARPRNVAATAAAPATAGGAGPFGSF